MITNVNLTPTEAAARLRVSVHSLKSWRIKGCGPKFLKYGRKVLYPTHELESFEAGRLRSNTAQMG